MWQAEAEKAAAAKAAADAQVLQQVVQVVGRWFRTHALGDHHYLYYLQGAKQWPSRQGSGAAAKAAAADAQAAAEAAKLNLCPS